MSEISIRRRSRQQSATIGTTTADSTTLTFEDAAGASVVVMNTPHTAATLLRVYGSHDNTAYRELFGSDGAAAEITLSRSSGTAVETVGTTTQQITVYTAVPGTYELPPAGFALRFVRLVADADMGEAATVHVVSKS